MITLIVTTSPGVSASAIGEIYGAFAGVTWRNAVERCDDDGAGRVFLDCETIETADYVRDQMDSDPAVWSYRVK